jgi:hypothetical protein
MKEVLCLVEAMLIGGGGCEAVRQTGTGINTDMGFSFQSAIELAVSEGEW